MEVHHHPDLLHKKKNFKEYFLEFLMIFLAVTLGFFAENIRESIKDKNQLHEYVQSMVNDLQSDTVMYNEAINFNLAHCRIIDSIITYLTQNKDNNNKELYYMARQLTMGSSVISPTAKTFEQMKSSGGLRLIKKQFIADSIGSYYQWIKRFDYWSDFQKQRMNEVISINDRIFDASVLFSIVKKIENENTSGFTQESNPALISTDRIAINAVMMRYQYYYGFLKLMNERALSASKEAIHLISLLKKQYHLE
jgi:hypothetical protein